MKGSATGAAISAVIPLLGEGREPLPLIETLERCAEVAEILLIESESEPEAGARTPIDARWRKVRVLVEARGRARQMNAGARVASGDILLFLHGDSRLDEAAVAEARAAVSRGATAAAAFRLGYRETRRSLRLLAQAGRWLSRIHPYALGDQGLAIRREAFVRLGGFPDVPILEDWLFLRALRRRTGFRILRSTCATSGRRFLRRGPLRQLLQNARILYRYGEGEDLAILAAEYNRRGDGRAS